MVDRSELYPGAVVTAKSKVVRVEGDRVILQSADDNLPGLRLSAILSVEPRPLAVGDMVRTLGGNKGRIAALTKGEACLVLEPAGFLSSPVLLAELTRIPEDAAEPAPAEKAMRFKVGDKVYDRDIGIGTVKDLSPPPYRYEVLFDEGGIAVCPEPDLSPAPAEERAP